MSSDFAKYMTLNNIITAINREPLPRIMPRSFRFDLITEKSQIAYHGRHDILEFSSCGKSAKNWENLTQEYLDYILGIEFLKKDFSQYHQKIIEQNIDNDKKIVLYDEYKPEIHVKFNIKEDNKKLILTK